MSASLSLDDFGAARPGVSPAEPRLVPGPELYYHYRRRGPLEGAVGLGLIGRYLVHPDLNRLYGGTFLDHGRARH